MAQFRPAHRDFLGNLPGQSGSEYVSSLTVSTCILIPTGPVKNLKV